MEVKHAASGAQQRVDLVLDGGAVGRPERRNDLDRPDPLPPAHCREDPIHPRGSISSRVTLRTMKPRFRTGEIVRIAGPAGAEAVVEEIAGPNEDGTGWLLTVRLEGDEGGREPVVLDEARRRADGLRRTRWASASRSRRASEEPGDRLELRLFTEITDGIEAARVAERIEEEVADLARRRDGHDRGRAALVGAVQLRARRHGGAARRPGRGARDPRRGRRQRVARVPATTAGAATSGGARRATPTPCWSCRRCTAPRLAFLPWSSPARRPDDERPLVVVAVADDEPEEPASESDEDASDAQPGDEEA